MICILSGLNCSCTPNSIRWEVHGTASAANVERQANSNGNIWQTGSTSATHIIDVSAGCNIITYFFWGGANYYIMLNIIKTFHNIVYLRLITYDESKILMGGLQPLERLSPSSLS
jgi:hypothetical protein